MIFCKRLILMMGLLSVWGGLSQAAPANTTSALPAAKLNKYENFYLAGALTVEQLQEFKAAGGVYVVDLREMSEKDCGEAAIAAKMGLQYMSAPMPKEQPITKETVAQVDKIVKAAQGKPVLLHCETGNRAAAWLAVHLTRKEKKPVEEAVQTAKGLGLKPGLTEDAVRKFLR